MSRALARLEPGKPTPTVLACQGRLVQSISPRGQIVILEEGTEATKPEGSEVQLGGLARYGLAFAGLIEPHIDGGGAGSRGKGGTDRARFPIAPGYWFY
jgi:hypothetical protein